MSEERGLLSVESVDTCRHGELEGDCPSCAACLACRGECGTCPYASIPPAKHYSHDLLATSDAWVDRHGDVWRIGNDGLMHTPETRPFPREHVEKKWGPLRLATPTDLSGGRA